MKKQSINFVLEDNDLKDFKILFLTKIYKTEFIINKINFRKNIKSKKARYYANYL